MALVVENPSDQAVLYAIGDIDKTDLVPGELSISMLYGVQRFAPNISANVQDKNSFLRSCSVNRVIPITQILRFSTEGLIISGGWAGDFIIPPSRLLSDALQDATRPGIDLDAKIHRVDLEITDPTYEGIRGVLQEAWFLHGNEYKIHSVDMPWIEGCESRGLKYSGRRLEICVDDLKDEKLDLVRAWHERIVNRR